MVTVRRRLGDLAEEIANNYLNTLGHRTLARNWTVGHLEVDIITLDAVGLHFVEVKSRTVPLTADPLENITWSKQRNLASAASKFLARVWTGGEVEVFFDVVSVIFDGAKRTVAYYPKAFIPIY